MVELNLRTINSKYFGIEVCAVDCSALAVNQVNAIREALHRNQLLVFRTQSHLHPTDEVKFYKMVDAEARTVWRDQTENPWEAFKVEQGNEAGTYQIPDEPGVLVLGKGEIDHFGLKVRLGGKRKAYGEEQSSQVLGGGALQWHIDGAFYAHDPCRYTQMLCVEAPSSSGKWIDYDDRCGGRLYCAPGATAFVSGRQAFRLLPEELQDKALRMRVHYRAHPFMATYHLGNTRNGLRVVDPQAEEKFEQGQDAAGMPIADPAAKVYPLVWTCPVTGEKALMAHPRCMHHLEETGKHDPRHLGVVESKYVLEKFMRPGIDPEYVYVHKWRPGDLLIWNNWSVWHSATGALAESDRRVQHLTAFNGARAPR